MNPSATYRALRAKPLFSAGLGLILAACAGSPPVEEPAVTKAPVAASAAPQAEAKPVLRGESLDRIAAVVNDDVILMSELDAHVAVVQKQLAARSTELPPVDVLRKQVLDQMITVRIELQQAANRGVSVSDDAVNQALSRIARDQNLTLDQLPDKLKAEGFDYAQFRQDLRDQLIVHNLEEQVVNDDMRITPQEVDDELRADDTNGNSTTQYHLSEILVATPSNPTAEQLAAARKKANDLYQKLKAGADFAAAAVASSDDQQALKGGDLGWRPGAQLPTIFTTVVQQLKPGEISEPVVSASGFHIVKLDDIKRTDEQHLVTQTHTRHILLRLSAVLNRDQAKAKLDDLRKQILAGADFAKLAQQNSEDPGSASQGGDLGWVDPGAMVPEFEEQMNKLQPGEISEPFPSQFGWHLLQVLGRRQSDESADYRKNKAYEAIFTRKSEEIVQRWVAELKDSSFIEYHLDG
jgi:peptidyl-prolyl cis-trans isomerase SurA